MFPLEKDFSVPAPAEIQKLVERFQLHREEYLTGNYNETQLRREFLDPMFKALGWDIDNEQGFAEAYKDVVHEDAIRIGDKLKAPDYGFRIGGTRKYFLEAKKPAEHIEGDPKHAYQLRRYGWSAKLPLSILSSFAEFAVYDCRIKPLKTDKASKARVKLLRCEEYLDRWDEIAIFSRDAILKGSFDRFADSTKSKRGTSEVDSEFLNEIESWRLSLARNLALRNTELDQRGLNFAVQRIIDRIVFLRIAEDRGIEDYGQLRKLLTGTKVYRRLAEQFHAADDRYNSGLFHFTQEKGRHEPPDEFTLSLKVDDDTLKEIVSKLYYPDSPYEFSVLPADILGQVYEQFLGKVIRLTPGHQPEVEEKPEVKKAGGVYYTPKFIVDYIVKQTVGRLLDGKTPKQVAKLKVLDPACGSGSFLIGAYQFLLDWHRDWYLHNSPELSPKEVHATKDGWRLTTAKRKEILLKNIFGVDIDSQAVEVTKLSLLLKVLEGENSETLARQKKLFHERALPDLGDNIKCGNSLIGPDFYDGQQLSLFDADEQYRINAFDWQTEFKPILKSGGFDAVIGNPPYVRIQRIEHAESDYLFANYQAPTSKMDLSLVFLEKGLDLAARTGRVGFICTSQWMTTDYGRKLRDMLRDGRLHEIADFGSLPVFANASTYPAIFVLSPTASTTLKYRRMTDAQQLNLPSIEAAAVREIRFRDLSEAPWSLGRFRLSETMDRQRLNWQPLSAFGRAYIGAKSGMNSVFVLEARRARELKLEKELLLPYALDGAEIERFAWAQPNSVLIYPYRDAGTKAPELIAEDELRDQFPKVHEYLSEFKAALKQRKDSRRRYATATNWYRHLRPGSFQYIRPEKIALKGIARRCCAGLLRQNTAFDGANCPSVILKEPGNHSRSYFLGLLNSRLATYHLCGVCPPKLSGYTRFSASVVTQLPIRVIDFTNKPDKLRHDRMVKLVDRMLALYEQLPKAKTDQDKAVLERQIATVDRQLDQLVYELYGLAAAEIALVEEATTRR